MVKKTFLVLILLLNTLSFGADDYNKDIVVKDQSRNDKVKTVFREMMNAYEEEDIEKFFSFVSEDRFEQDYMTFYDAIDEDIRIYDILSIDTWVNKINEDGVKRFLEVQWEKRYESSKPVPLNARDLAVSDEYEINQKGTTEFLFDEINGKYKLIKIAGNNFWGGSLKEWTEEVGDIADQESKETVGDNVNGEYQSSGGGIPDLTVTITNIYQNSDYILFVDFDISNIGTGSTESGVIEYTINCDGYNLTPALEYSSNIAAGDIISITYEIPSSCDAYFNGVIVDPNSIINELNENNNEAILSLNSVGP